MLKNRFSCFTLIYVHKWRYFILIFIHSPLKDCLEGESEENYRLFFTGVEKFC
jgi:hypothetical protein